MASSKISVSTKPTPTVECSQPPQSVSAGLQSTARPIDASSMRVPGAIKRIGDNANTVAALLSVVNILRPADRSNALVTCAAIARGISCDLEQLVGGTA